MSARLAVESIIRSIARPTERRRQHSSLRYIGVSSTSCMHFISPLPLRQRTPSAYSSIQFEITPTCLTKILCSCGGDDNPTHPGQAAPPFSSSHHHASPPTLPHFQKRQSLSPIPWPKARTGYGTPVPERALRRIHARPLVHGSARLGPCLSDKTNGVAAVIGNYRFSSPAASMGAPYKRRSAGRSSC